MRRYFSIPLLFFALAAALGLFLRWQFVEPTPGVRFTWFLHSHSHVMFLGWVFNSLYLSFVDHHIPEENRPGFTKLFVALQVPLVAMMISFPIQGYGTWSIIFSTLHTMGSLIFIVLFFRNTRTDNSVSAWFARTALIFFFISTAGPFALGYLMANGLGQTVWYNFSIFYYLHFQYNGFFLFGIFSLFFQLLETKRIPFEPSAAKLFGKFLAIACVPAYALSILFARPHFLFYFVGGVAAIIQIIALYTFIRILRTISTHIRQRFQRMSYILLKMILFALALKLILQFFSTYPDVARFAYEQRTIVIAYLHLVLVGIISVFLIIWYLERELLGNITTRLSVGLMLIGFVGSEICLVVLPWWSEITRDTLAASMTILIFSVLMFAAACLLCIAYKWNVHSPGVAPD